MKTAICLFFGLLCLLVVDFEVQAVMPPPDGGYANKTTAEGQDALFSLTSGHSNTAIGFAALKANTTGDRNTATAAFALFSNQSGSENTATGYASLFFNRGSWNSANGVGALHDNSTGNKNTANGGQALTNNTIGNNNTANGFQALANTTTGSSNIGLGRDAGSGVTTADDVICIGTAGANVSHSCYIGNIFEQSPPCGLAVFVASDGKLGTIPSSRRFKEDIRPMNQASEAILALQPVTFRYKKDVNVTQTVQFGLVAEEVERVNPDLVVRDKEGKPYSVRYDQVNAMLLNEFLKEHRTVQELKAAAVKHEANVAKQDALIAGQQKQIDALTAGLQRVSEQLELSKVKPRVVTR